MNWYKYAKKYILARLRGEYWIFSDGTAHYADGDIGDMNHEAYVLDKIRSEIADSCGVDFDPEYGWGLTVSQIGSIKLEEMIEETDDDDAAWELRQEFENDPYEFYEKLAKENGWSDEELSIANDSFGADSRKYAMMKWNWKRVEGNHVDTIFLTDSDIGIISNGLYDAYDEDVFKESFHIYCFSTNKLYQSIPYADLENGASAFTGRETR